MARRFSNPVSPGSTVSRSGSTGSTVSRSGSTGRAGSASSTVRRDQIVAALGRLMAERGYEGATVGEIARSAGLAPGLVHYHFRDKRAILLQLIETLASRALVRETLFVERAKSTPRARVVGFVDAYLARGTDADPNAVACWVFISAEAVRDPAVRDAFQRVVEGALGRLRRLVRNALPDATDLDVAAASAAIFAAVQGYFLLSVSAPRTIPPSSAAATVRRMLDGLLPPPAARTRTRKTPRA